MKSSINSFLIVLLLLSCTGKKEVKEEKQVENQETELVSKIEYPVLIDKSNPQLKDIEIHDIAKVTYLKVETKDDCLFPRKWSFSGLYISGDDLLISFGNNILHFNMNGIYQNHIGNKGGAPFEFAHGGIFSVNESTQEVFLLDFAKQRTLVYGYDGKYKRSFKNESYFDRFCVLNDSLAVCSNNDINQEDRIFTISLKNGKKKEVLLGAKKTDAKKLMVNIGAFSRTNQYQDMVYLCVGTSDTIFAYDTNLKKLLPIYIQSPLNKNEDEVKTVPYLQFETAHIASILINDSPMPNFTYWFNKENGNLSKVRIKNKDLDDYVLAWGTNKPNVVFDILEMPRLKEQLRNNSLSGELKSLVEAAEDEDNPIIMIAEIEKNVL